MSDIGNKPEQKCDWLLNNKLGASVAHGPEISGIGITWVGKTWL